MEKVFDTGKFLRIQRYSNELFSKKIETAAARCELSKPEADMLLFFANNPSFHSAADAAKYRGVSKAYVSKALTQLLDKGYISTEVDAHDRRCQKIAVTEKAAKAITTLRAAQESFSQMLTVNMSETERDEMLRLMEKMMDGIEKTYVASKLAD